MELAEWIRIRNDLEASQGRGREILASIPLEAADLARELERSLIERDDQIARIDEIIGSRREGSG